MHELERISLDAYLPIYGPGAISVAGATCLRAPHAPDSPMVNRVVGLGMDEATFVAAARYDVAQLDPELADDYDRAAPYWHHFRGLERYWRKRLEAIGAETDG